MDTTEIQSGVSKPLLLLDVDGVLCPWGDPPPGYRQVFFKNEPDWISDENGRRLRELAKRVEIVWATARDLEVLETIGPAHDLPPYTVIEFGTMKISGKGRTGILLPRHFNGMTWKLDWIHRFSERWKNRPLVWIDDDLHADAYDWAGDRESGVLWQDSGTPTLLIQPNSNVGITEEHYARLGVWLDQLR